MKKYLHILPLLLLFLPLSFYGQPSDLPWDPDPDCNSIVTSGIVAVSCGVVEDLPLSMRYTIGLIDLNGAMPASGRVDVSTQQAAYHHPSWHIDSIGNIFGLTMDHCGNVYATASSNYASVFFFSTSLLRYGELGGGANDLSAAGTIYKIDAQTAQAGPWVVLPQQAYNFDHHDCEGFQTFNRTTGPGLGNITFRHDTRNFYVTNFEDGRIYRIDTLGTIVESYDPFDLDNGNAGPPDLIETPYAVALNNDGTALFFGTMGTGDFGSNPAGVYSIPLNADGSFVGTIDNSSMPAGATWDNLVGTETFHTSVDYFGTCYISGMEFTPDDRLLVGQRIGCNNVIQGSYNHQGKTHLFSDDGSGIYSVLDGIIVSSNGVFAPTNAYGGVSYFELPNGEVQYVMSNGDMLSEQGPHGIVVSPENVFGSFGAPASPQGIIAYNDPSVTDDPKGIGGDVFVFKECSCAPICPEELLTEPLSVCSNDPFSLNFAVSTGNISPTAVWTFEDGTEVPDPDNVSIEHTDCAPGVYTFFVNATCEADQVTEYLDTLEVTVVTDDLSPFFTTIEEDCQVDLLIDPDCAAYIELIGTIPDIMFGDSGTVTLELSQTTDPFCVQQTVALEFNCLCGFEDFSFVQESCDQGEYYITIDFRPEGAGDFFSLSDQNGAHFGTYNYAELPLQIGPFIGDAGTTYTLFVQDDDLTECSAFFSFGPLYCPPGQAEWVATNPSCLIEFGSLEAVNVVGGAAPYQYSIDGGQTFSNEPVFTDLEPGSYQVVIQDAMGEIVESTELIVPAPELSINLAAQASLLLGESTSLDVQLNLLPHQIDTVFWTPQDGLSCTDCLDPIAMPTQTTEYTVTVIDIYGCVAEARVLVVVDPSPAIYIPNAFSPNGDGINDLFLIYARDGSVERIRKFQVFDRWGELVFEYENFDPNNPAYGWDGYFRGELMDPAVFAYYAIVDFIDGRQILYEGDITLVR